MKKISTIMLTVLALTASASVLSAQVVKMTETKPGLLKRAKISADSAIALAKAKLPKATLDAAEIEEENGKLIYSFDFKTAGKSGIDELAIDALTGKLVGKVQHESPEDEKKEAAMDAKKAPAKKPAP